MDVTVLFFASAREAAGTSRTSVEVGVGTTLSQLGGLLTERYGESLAAVMVNSALWVNGEPGELGTTLQSGDEVAVLPSVSGGA